jgi:hypothetical protein
MAGSILLMGCLVRLIARPNLCTPYSSSSADLNLYISSAPPKGTIDGVTPIQVEVQVCAKDHQNPVFLVYTMTNMFTSQEILAPVLVQPSMGPHIKLISATPISGTAIAQSLKPRMLVTGSMMLQIEPMQWQESLYIRVTTPFDGNSPEDQVARNQGGTAWAYGGMFITFRIKEGRIEASQFGWEDSAEPAWITLEDGTRVRSATVNPNYRSPTLTPDIKATDILPSSKGTKTP